MLWLCCASAIASAQEIIHQAKIWDQAPHNAFTDLIRYRERLICVFREGSRHVSPDGAIRVLSSRDGREWTSAALIRSADGDLRDPHLSITPKGDLMLVAAAALIPGGPHRHQTYAWFSRDGSRWTGPVAIGEPDYWLWRVVWHKSKAYGVGYPTGGEARAARLYVSTDGRKFQSLVDALPVEGRPNESAIVFQRDSKMLILLRRDTDPNSALLLSAAPPYRTWHARDLSVRIGGPQLLLLPDGKLLAAGRFYEGKPHTALAWLDTDSDSLAQFLALPSGGDTSYPGLVLDDGHVWVSYYSSHEGKTAIYGARVKLP